MVIFYLIYIGLIIFSNYQQVDCISCKDRNGNVEWILIIKPTVSGMSGGKGYLYKSSVSSNSLWTYVQGDLAADDMTVKDPNEISKLSPIGRTLNDVYLNPSDYQYILYNNEIPSRVKAKTLSPKDKSNRFGSGKGALIWDKVGGSAIFIVHSARHFLPPITEDLRRHFSRQNYDSNGHSFLCVNLPLTAVETIMRHLIIIKALVYDIYMTTSGSWDKLERSQIEIYEESNYLSLLPIIQRSDLSRGSHSSMPNALGISSLGISPRSSLSSIPSNQNSVLGRVSTQSSSTFSKSSSSGVHSRRPSFSSSASESKPNGRKVKMIKNNIANSLLKTTDDTSFTIISKSFKEPGGIWKKIKAGRKLNFFIKPHSSLSLSRSCSKIMGIRVETNHATGLTQRIHWNYNEDKFNFGFHRDKEDKKYIYCHTDIEDKIGGRIGKSLGGSRAGLALCLEGSGVNELTKIVKNTAVKSCPKTNS